MSIRRDDNTEWHAFLGGCCLAGGPTSLRTRGNTVAVGEAIQTRRPFLWIASLGNVPLAMTDGGGYCLASSSRQGEQHRMARLWAGTV
ncbi:MAG: hypothetical protein LBT00_08325 [Spirochaetaceae bacterium]|nr:hypothetical protein [Spirochaetaceae bacterium]